MKRLTNELNFSLKLMFLAIPLLLAIPFIAMQFTTAVNWSLGDFLVAALLLVLTVCAIAFVFKKISATVWQIGFCIVIVITLLFVWAQLAVGLI